MIGIFLVTHGALGEALLQNVCHILNKRPPQIAQLGLAPQEDPHDLLPLARRILAELDQGDGVLVMTDVWGATPANLAVKLLESGRVEGLAGVNLPMLMRALTYREKGLDVMVAKAISGARDGVINMGRDA